MSNHVHVCGFYCTPQENIHTIPGISAATAKELKTDYALKDTKWTLIGANFDHIPIIDVLAIRPAEVDLADFFQAANREQWTLIGLGKALTPCVITIKLERELNV